MGPVAAALRAMSTEAILAFQREGSVTVQGVALGEGDIMVRQALVWHHQLHTWMLMGLDTFLLFAARAYTITRCSSCVDHALTMRR